MRTALITGASGGLGRAIAEIFSAAGWRLVLNCRGPVNVSEPHALIQGDLRHPLTIGALEQAAAADDVEALIHCAAVRLAQPLSEMAPADILATVQTNLLAPMLLTQALWPTFQRLGRGTVVFVSSLAATDPGPGETAYAASKAGLSGFARALQREATAIGVRVVDVQLGAMRTPMTAGRDQTHLIGPMEAAAEIWRLCELPYQTLRIPEVTLCRSRYA